MLGCAPISVAQILPWSDAWVPRHHFLKKELGSDGRMDRRSVLTRFTAPAHHDACTGWNKHSETICMRQMSEILE